MAAATSDTDLPQSRSQHFNHPCGDVAFKKVYQNTLIRVFNGIMRKGSGRGRQDFHYQKKDGSSPVTEEGRKRRAAIMKQKADQAVVEKSFNQMTVDLMKSRGMNILPLAEATGLSRDTIKNMRNDSNRLFPIQEVVAVAIALHLDPEVSKEYIRRAPTNFLDTDEMYCYRYALNHWYKLTVAKRKRLRPARRSGRPPEILSLRAIASWSMQMAMRFMTTAPAARLSGYQPVLPSPIALIR